MVEASQLDGRATEIEALLRKHIKHKTLTEDAIKYMALLVQEDNPANSAELHGLISDFLTDGMVYTEDQAFKVSELLSKQFVDKNLVITANRDTIIAEKLNAPMVMKNMNMKGGTVKDDDFLDPFLAKS
jgi:hypothetical protein